MSQKRFVTAMGIFAILATLATVTLDGPIRLVTLIFLAGLAVKTYLATLRRDDDQD